MEKGEKEEKRFIGCDKVSAEILSKTDGLLTAEQEFELAALVEQGDAAARDKLICANQKLVTMVASRFAGHCKSLDMDDLKQAGNLGLIRAVDLYDRNRGYRFSTYAVWWIRQTIMREISDKGRVIRLPVHVLEKISQIRRVAIELEQTTGELATAEKVAEVMGEPLEKIKNLWDLLSVDSVVSMDKSLGDDGNATLADVIADDKNPSPQDDSDSAELRRQILRALDSLSPREKWVLCLRFGLKDGQARTLEEIGDMYSVSRERIRQIESKALRRLRNPRVAKFLRDFRE